jgi:glycosyltransferase involved in cell wall biosynthesis
MKILHVIPTFAPAWSYGGPIYAALGLTRELAKQGQKVSVITTNVDGPGILNVPLGRPVSIDGVEVWYFPVEYPRWWYFSRELGNALKRTVKNFDLVHVHSMFLWPTAVAAFWCRKHHVPYIIRPAGSLDPICLTKPYERWWVSSTSRAKKQLYLKTLGRMDLQHASALHFTSQAELEAARPLKLRPPGFVVPLGVDLEQIEVKEKSTPFRERYPQLEGKKIVLFLSRLDPIKGLDLLIPALGSLSERRKDFAFVVAGNGTPAYKDELDMLINRHKLEERTIFLGFVEGSAKWSLLREADLFVLPSYHENFGVAVVDAMTAGIPVAISNQVSIHQEVAQAGAGIVTHLDSNAIAGALEQLLDDSDLRREMGEKGTRLVRAKFTWSRVAKEMIEAYHSTVVCGVRNQ